MGGLEEGHEKGAVVFGEEFDGRVGVVGDEGFAFEGEEALFVRLGGLGGVGRVGFDGCVAVPEGAEVEEEVRVCHAVAGLELGDDGFGGYDAVVGFGNEEADRFEGLGGEFEERGGFLLGFGHAEENEAGNVVRDGADEVVFADEAHGGVGVLEADVAAQCLSGLAVGKIELC